MSKISIINTKVNLLDNPIGVYKNSLVFSFGISSENEVEIDGFRYIFVKRISDFKSSKFIYDSGWIKSNITTGIKLNGLSEKLEDNELYYYKIAVKLKTGEISDYSPEKNLVTAIKGFQKDAIWDKSGDNFIFMRSTFSNENYEKVVLSITALSPEAQRQFVYEVFVNGKSILLGPPRINQNTLYFNSADITDALNSGENLLSGVLMSTSEKAFVFELTGFTKDGNKVSIASRTRTFPADNVFRISNSIGTHYYKSYANNIDSRLWPTGYEAIGYCDKGWNEPLSIQNLIDKYRLAPSEESNLIREEFCANNISISKLSGSSIIDLGKEIVGSLSIDFHVEKDTEIKVFYGEQLTDDGHVKYHMNTTNCYEESWLVSKGKTTIKPFDMLCFRYVEIEGLPYIPKASEIHPFALTTKTSLSKDLFITSDNKLLNDIYELLRHTTYATTQDLFVDSQSRERGAYEGDVLVNQYLVSLFTSDFSVERFTLNYLENNRTWPAEYILLMPYVAWEDYMATGDVRGISNYYNVLGSKNFNGTLSEYGFIHSGNQNPQGTNAVLTDWPPSERDGYETSVLYNTVLESMAVIGNHYMSLIAKETGHEEDAKKFEEYENTIKSSMIKHLYNEETGAFSDGMFENGIVSAHFSQHATAYALAAGVYNSPEMARNMGDFLRKQGEIKMSVYGAFFLFKGLYESGNGDFANKLLLSEDTHEGARTWSYMLYKMNATITTEAWNTVNKPNMTLSHPWGSAPAFAILRGIFGIKPTTPGFKTFEVKPQTALISSAEITVPTIVGNINIKIKDGKTRVTAPANTEYKII